MFKLIWSRRFKRSYRKIKYSGQFDRERLRVVLDFLHEAIPLPFQYQDHALAGEYKDCRECHLKGDLLLMYEVTEKRKEITLLDIGSHSDLFG